MSTSALMAIPVPITPPQSPRLAAHPKLSSSPPATSVSPNPTIHVPDNYVQHTLSTVPALPPIKFSNLLGEINYVNLTAVSIGPVLTVWGLYTTAFEWRTVLFAVIWYAVTGCVLSS